ncbi:MAG: DUF2117 domain-containing protein [Candidatus Methanoperedens sp.]|nr:DUF2117 domain-containing protein [Candidatus Methanoperedens sp.]
MRIGIILHGPEIIDVGSAKRIIDMFSRGHDVMAKLGGTMGRTAVLIPVLKMLLIYHRGLRRVRPFSF